MYLAKPDETLIEHTKNLLSELDTLKNAYGNKINIDWDDLVLCCKWHDIGKLNPQFQDKITTKVKIKDELYHNFISAILIQPARLYNQYMLEGYTQSQARNKTSAIVYAIACHHIRPFNIKYQDTEELRQLLKTMESNINSFPFHELSLDKPDNIKLNYRKYYKLGAYPTITTGGEYYEYYVLLKGLLNKIDYAASGHYPIEIVDNTLPTNLNLWKDRNNILWNDAQIYAYEKRDESTMFIAQTGIGKTEAALRWINDDKAFFTLPLQAAINSTYDRIKQNIQKNSPVAILHSNVNASLYDSHDMNLRLAKSYAYPLTITTIDQIFKFVYRYSNYENLYSTMMYSKVVIDEIQAYDAALTAYLIYGLKMISDIGGKYLIMSATIPPYIIDMMKKYGLAIPKIIPTFYDESLQKRHLVKVEHKQISATNIASKYQNDRTLIICNTVKKANQLYDELSYLLPNVEIRCIHSRFIRKDKKQNEKDIMMCGKMKHKKPVIWIATQIVEASLDIDFDCLFTELSELSGLYQRMGRCYRKRNNNGITNVFVYDGGDQPTSGIHQDNGVVDYDLFQLSKKALHNINGLFSEKEKIKVLNSTYTTNNVKGTTYYNKIKDTISYLESVSNAIVQPTENEIKKRFRNINTIDVIPIPVYMKSKKIIDTACANNNWDTLQEYMVSIYSNNLKYIVDELHIGAETIGLLECEYNKNKGVIFE